MYGAAFEEDFQRAAKRVVSIIIRILQSQASVLTPQAEVEAEKDDTS